MFLCTSIFAQKIGEKDVPAGIMAAFQKKYPAANGTKWNKEEGNYEASFKLNKEELSVVFDTNGNISETETEIALNSLPAGVLDYVKTHYPGKKVSEGAKITDASGAVTYEVEIKGMDLLFDKNGKFIKEVKN